MEWISVSDRLPEDDREVLVWGCGFMAIGWCNNGKDGRYWCANDFDYKDGEVTHWRPLPEPPKEDA